MNYDEQDLSASRTLLEYDRQCASPVKKFRMLKLFIPRLYAKTERSSKEDD